MNKSLSDSLYNGLCSHTHVGSQEIVQIRREIMDIAEKIHGPIHKYNTLNIMQSGSYREGFRFTSSDQDIMQWLINYKVICEISQFSNYDAAKLNIILMKHSESSPGFVMLKLLTPTRNFQMFSSSVVVLLKDCYISSKIFREISHDYAKTYIWIRPMELHGPVTKINMEYLETDIGMCIACPYWPQTASSWIERCEIKKWPVKSLLDKIKDNGCHVMPIGSKTNINEHDMEWRISFSLAEQIIVYSINHTQFLCYAILKVFLKEVLSREDPESLICSYFLKTILFWEIQHNSMKSLWSPSNLFSCFWMCYRRLCQCVLDSNCPNFFIPENNMFSNKIVGATREALLIKLCRYYDMKEGCLFLSPTLGVILSSPTYMKPISEGLDTSAIEMDDCIKNELSLQIFTEMSSINENLIALQSVYKLSKQPLTELQSLALQYFTSFTLIKTAFVVANHFCRAEIKLCTD